jgi:hypothetical protein
MVVAKTLKSWCIRSVLEVVGGEEAGFTDTSSAIVGRRRQKSANLLTSADLCDIGAYVRCEVKTRAPLGELDIDESAVWSSMLVPSCFDATFQHLQSTNFRSLSVVLG